jgi:predicted protein tyrosine phosphatase/transcriptional regulator with XRE-family HTH domain
MRIHVCGRGSVETMAAPDEPFIVISISSGDAPPAEVPDAPHRLGVLRLWFDDFNPERAVRGSRGTLAFTNEDAQQIWEFVETHREAAQHLIVHCDAGISRSPAVERLCLQSADAEQDCSGQRRSLARGGRGRIGVVGFGGPERMERKMAVTMIRSMNKSSRSASDDNLLGIFLKDRRARLDPAAFGFGCTRRRTPGLRREEVAQRADVSATWYTWLEQGRGGAPSADTLERIACALMLTEPEREHLFLLAQHRPPEVRYRVPGCVSPRLQRVLDSLEFSPAYVKTSAWDIVAWNHAAEAVLTNYGTLEPEQRNLLRRIFCNSSLRANMPNWESVARMMVATFRLDTTRAGASEAAKALVEELSRLSPEFASMWLDNDVSTYGEGTKQIYHPVMGELSFEYSAFSVDDQPDLGLVIFTPATAADLERVKAFIAIGSPSV